MEIEFSISCFIGEMQSYTVKLTQKTISKLKVIGL